MHQWAQHSPSVLAREELLDEQEALKVLVSAEPYPEDFDSETE